MNATLLQDEADVRRLAGAYSHAVMRRDAEAAAAVYTEDGILSAFYGPDIVGRAAVAQALKVSLAPMDFIVQSCTAEVIEVEGDRARSSWSVVEWYRYTGKPELGCCFGVYEDTLVRTTEGWRFTRRRFHPFYRGTVPSEGKSYRTPTLEHGYQFWPPMAGRIG